MNKAFHWIQTAAAAALGIALSADASAASPTDFVQNGSFESSTLQTSTQLANSYNNLTAVTGWTSADASSNYSSTLNYYIIKGQGVVGDAIGIKTTYGPDSIWQLPVNADPNGGNFMLLDADPWFNGTLQQTLTGLDPSTKYRVTFSWAAVQLSSKSGATTEQLQVSLGNQTQSTVILNNASGGSTPWTTTFMDFTPGSASSVLSFLAVGTPNGAPPAILLDGVSVMAAPVPEPARWP